jgi:hypothetical protein
VSPRRTLLALPLAALAIAGCGGGGDDSTESTPVTTVEAPAALTKDELIEQGDAICAEVNAAVGTVGASSAETGNPAAQTADLYSGMIASLKNLGAPQEADGYPEFAAAADELSTAEGEANASSALSSFQAVAAEYGFENCGEGPSAPVAGAAPESGETGSAEAPEESEAEAVEPEAEAEPAPEPAPETGGAGGTAEGGGTGGGGEAGGTTGGESGGIGPG